MFAGEEPREDRVEDARGAVDHVERRVEAVLLPLLVGERRRVLVGDPAGVHAVHVDTVADVVDRRRARHHVERSLRHVRVRMPVGLELAVELSLHRRDVDDVPVRRRTPQHQRLQARVQHERGDGVHEVDLEELHRRDLGEREPPAVAIAEIDLLKVGIELPRGENAGAAAEVVLEEGDLARLSGIEEQAARRERGRRAQVLVAFEQRPLGG